MGRLGRAVADWSVAEGDGVALGAAEGAGEAAAGVGEDAGEVWEFAAGAPGGGTGDDGVIGA